MTQTIEIEVKGLDFYYSGDVHALQKISFPIYKNKVTALIGPSGCGKTTLLRCFNRMHDLSLGWQSHCDSCGELREGLRHAGGSAWAHEREGSVGLEI